MECAITLSRIGISKILLVTDFSPESENALQCSLTLARRYGSKLLITRVFPAEVSTAMGDTWPVLMDSARRSAEASMEQLQQREDLKPLPHEVVTRSSDTWDGISQVVLDRSIDLVVTGTHKRGNINSLIMGSIAEKVIRHAPCPVLTLGPHVWTVGHGSIWPHPVCYRFFFWILSGPDLCSLTRRAGPGRVDHASHYRKQIGIGFLPN